MTRALIFGVTGQDGSYLAEHLADQGVEVVGAVRRFDHPRVQELGRRDEIRFVFGDLLDQSSLIRALRAVKPDEVYNLAALTSPGARWAMQTPPLMLETTGVAPVRLLDAISFTVPDTRFVHASSSAVYEPERYGAYGAAKKMAHDAVAGYRSYGALRASNAIFFSHTSPRQQDHFLIRRLVRTVVEIADGQKPSLRVTNLANRRDWGWAPDFVKALVIIVRGENPGDFPVRTGVTHSVRDVLTTAGRLLGLDYPALLARWPDAGRAPTETEPAPAGGVPGWRHETTFAEMIKKLIEFEVLKREA